MLLKLLRQKRTDIDHDLLCDYLAAFKGGKAFHSRIERFLPKRPSEDIALYDFRKRGAHYLNYAGPIVSYLSALVFTERPTVVTEPAKLDVFYASFFKDCDKKNGGMPLMSALRDRLTRALVEQRSWILIDFPAAPTTADGPVLNRAQWEEMGLGRAYLCPLNECDVIDWEVDDDGELEWALQHQVDTRRRSIATPRGGMITERWTLWTRTDWTRYEITYEVGKEPNPEDTDVPEVGTGKVATKGHVPLVRVEVPDELWAMNILFDAQIEQARKRNNLSFGMDRTCFAREIMKAQGDASGGGVADSAGGRGPVVGWGYREVIGTEESVEFISPPSDSFGVIAEYTQKLKDEIYRVVHQMALGVENNAAAVGRSGESKQADNDATTVVVRALAEVVRLTLQRVLDLVALGRKDKIVWTIGGMDGYVEVDLEALTANAATMDSLAIPSATARRELWKKWLAQMLNGSAPEVLDKIATEVDKAITDEDVRAAIELKNAPPPPPPGSGKPANESEPNEDDAAAED